MIDFILPYVDCNDKNWQKTYIDTRRKMDLSTEINPLRYRSWDNLQYIFRGIDLFMPYIRKVFLIVSNIEQIPSWLNTEKVNIVLHKDFIPEEFLPTFNSCTIEMFLPNINGLSENFIYSNDDIFILNEIKENEIIENNIPKTNYSFAVGTGTMYKTVMFNEYKKVSSLFGKKLKNCEWVKPEHSFTVFNKLRMKKLYSKLENDIYNSCTKFRERKNFNQNIYSHYDYFLKKYSKSNRKYKYVDFNSFTINDIKQEILGTNQILCLNDNIILENFDIVKQEINKCFEKKFPNKSKYELGYIETQIKQKVIEVQKEEKNDEKQNKKDFIDFVFPYVTSDDPYWQKLYKENVVDTNTWATGIERFRDAGTLKYLFRSLEKNLPWLNKIHMIVNSETQIPSWLNTEKVNIVLHKDFIPDTLLPTFNSTTIEMFLPNISGLSENFIYSNDDIFFFKKLNKNTFFEKNIPSYQMNFRDFRETAPGDVIRRNCYNLLTQNFDNKNRVITTQHGTISYKLSWLQEFFNNNKEILENSCTKFRSDKNFNQYVYAFYQMFYKTINNTEKKIFSSSMKEKFISKILSEDFNKFDMVCINDDNSTSEEDWNKVLNKLNKLLPNKSKYEL